jgi:hypothetical protein
VGVRGSAAIVAVQIEEEESRYRWASREEKKWAAGFNRKREVPLGLSSSKHFVFKFLFETR